MNHDHPAPPPLSREEAALVIIRAEGFVNSSHAAGSILASDGTAWRYNGDGLTEVPWSEYERALADDPADWPPYTITFTVSPSSTAGTVHVDVSTIYDMGLMEGSRGGNDTSFTMRQVDGRWRVIDVEYTMFDD